jgi:hypothetical protein
MSRPQSRFLPMYSVKIRPHRIGRWSIAAHRARVPAASADHARLIVVREAHRRAGLPPVRRYVRESLAHASVKSIGPVT